MAVTKGKKFLVQVGATAPDGWVWASGPDMRTVAMEVAAKLGVGTRVVYVALGTDRWPNGAPRHVYGATVTVAPPDDAPLPDSFVVCAASYAELLLAVERGDAARALALATAVEEYRALGWPVPGVPVAEVEKQCRMVLDASGVKHLPGC